MASTKTPKAHRHCIYCIFCLCVVTLIQSTIGKSIRIGTRPSPLALIQANSVAKILVAANPSLEPPTIVAISASGDSKGEFQDAPLAMRSIDFTGSLDEALQAGNIDLAVHSLKDIPPTHRWKNSAGFILTCPLPREDPADVLVGPYKSLDSIPSGSKIGTSSIRRQAQVFSVCGDMAKVVNIRGNVHARCQALKEGAVDVLILANAGLNRLDVPISYTRIPTDMMLPGACQGIVAAVYHRDNQWAFEEWFPEDKDAVIALCAERTFLDILDRSSPWAGRPPLAGLMEQSSNKDEWIFRGILARPDGSRVLKASATLQGHCSKADAEAVALKVGLELLDEAGSNFYEY